MTSPVNSCYPVNPVAETQVNAPQKQANPSPADYPAQDTVQISKEARAALASGSDAAYNSPNR